MSGKEVLQNAENWHRTHSSAGQIDFLKELLEKETETKPYNFWFNGKLVNTTTREATFTPILHNPGKIYLQFCGWSINLMEDGTWHWEDTTGG